MLESLRQAERDDPPETAEEERSIQEKKYRIRSALWEAAVGLGDEAAPSFQTLEATQEHLAQLNDLLADSPLQYVAAP